MKRAMSCGMSWCQHTITIFHISAIIVTYWIICTDVQSLIIENISLNSFRQISGLIIIILMIKAQLFSIIEVVCVAISNTVYCSAFIYFFGIINLTVLVTALAEMEKVGFECGAALKNE